MNFNPRGERGNHIPRHKASVVICGAGIAGISAAYHLTVRHKVRDVVLVDERGPFSLTSDKSAQCYRNWWPGPGDAMVRLMNRSIDLLEELARESDNSFNLGRQGYLFVTADRSQIPDFEQEAEESCGLGAGPLRIHTGGPGDPIYTPAPASGFEGLPTGADLILDPDLIQMHFPFLSQHAVAALHARRCGRMSAQQLGMYLLGRARESGASLMWGRVEAVGVRGGRVQTVEVNDGSASRTISSDTFVNAAGPLVVEVGRLLGLDLPVTCELHAKIAFSDYLGIISQGAPLYYWSDPQWLPWSDEERDLLAESGETRWLLAEFPPGPHGVPEGTPGRWGQLCLWTYDNRPVQPVLPVPAPDPQYLDVVLRGLSTMIPGLQAYFERLPRPAVDGGYFAKTRENRPLIGPLPVEGAHVIGALSGFGIGAGCGAGELLAAHVTGADLPSYAKWFTLERYHDPQYAALFDLSAETGQL
ncbi:MAG: FAD-binding oxidoreductase [Anaerolineae bacterium]